MLHARCSILACSSVSWLSVRNLFETNVFFQAPGSAKSVIFDYKLCLEVDASEENVELDLASS